MDPVSWPWESVNPGRDPVSCVRAQMILVPGNVIWDPENDTGAGKKKRVLLMWVYGVCMVATQNLYISNIP